MNFFSRVFKPYITQLFQGLLRWIYRSVMDTHVHFPGRDSPKPSGDMRICEKPVFYKRPPTPNPIADKGVDVYECDGDEYPSDRTFRPIG